MNASIYRISLDIQDAYANVSLDVKRGDLGRRIYITLTDGGCPYHISRECYAVFTAAKPDGNIVFNHCSIEGNTIIYELTPQTVAVEGLIECEVKLYGADDKLITSACFNLVIHNTVYNEGDEIESEEEVDALTHLISEATTAISESKETTEKGRVLIEKLDQDLDDIHKQIDVKADVFVQPEEPEDAEVGTLWFDTDEEPEKTAAVFVQPEEPEDAEVGTLWFDTDEEPENTEVLFVPQELTEDQKKQARANIGASDLDLVTIDLVSMGMPTLNMDTRETVSLETDTAAMKETADNNFVEYIVSAEYSGMIFNSIRIVVPPGGTVGTFAIGSILICVSILYSTDGNGVSACAFVTKELPGVTEEDNGKIVQVVNGKWQLATMPDTYNKTEIDTIMGAYIADIDTLIGGDS